MKFRERRVGRKRFTVLVAAAGISLLLNACQTNQGPTAEELAASIESGKLADIDATGFKQDESLRVRFQPPIGNARPVRGELAQDVNLELVIFNLDPATGMAIVGGLNGEALATSLSTATATVSFADGIYSALWNVGPTAAEAAGDFVRVEIRPAGIPHEQVCNDPWGACLGYFDARIVHTGRTGPGGAAAPGIADAGAYAAIEAAGKKLENTITVPDHGTVAVNFKLLAGTESLPTDEVGLAGLVALAGQGDKLDMAGNCSSDDFSRPGQGLQAVGAGLQAVGAGLQAVGAVGGLFVDSPGRDYDQEHGLPGVTSNQLVATQLLEVITLNPDGHDVAVLIVDSFNRVYGLPAGLLSNEDLPEDGLDELVKEGVLSHGALVFHQAKQLAAATTGDGTPWPVEDGADTAKFHVGGTREGAALLIKAVDAATLNTDDLAATIRDALAQVSAHGYKHVVVNMSFAIVPCAVSEDVGSTIGTGTIPTFEDYVASLLQVNAINPDQLDALGQMTAEPLALTQDPFFQYLKCPLPSSIAGIERCDGTTSSSPPIVKSMVHVAASGNFGNDYALYPAALPSVISVGSVDVTDDGYALQRSAFSNAATVLAPGALYRLVAKETQSIVYAGTSFAAPVVSIFTALDGMASTPLCDAGSLATNPLSAHALAGLDLNDEPLVPAFRGSSPVAVDSLCE